MREENITTQVYTKDMQVILDEIYGSEVPPEDAAERLILFVGEKTGYSLQITPAGGTFIVVEVTEDKYAALDEVNEAINDWAETLYNEYNE